MSDTKAQFLKRVQYIDNKLAQIIKAAEDTADKNKNKIQHTKPQYRDSAKNLVSYMAFRSFDIDKLQCKMMNLGFSDLSDITSHVHSTLLSVKGIADIILGQKPEKSLCHAIEDKKNSKLLENSSSSIFGGNSNKRSSIMVTMPIEAADDIQLIKSMLEAGMDCARINCAHDTPEVWDKIITNIHQACAELTKPCAIIMDIAGPKIRTGSLDDKALILKPNDTLLLTKNNEPGSMLPQIHISCTLKSIFDNAKVGNRVFFDDGKIEGVIEKADKENLSIKITNAKPEGSKLKADKGINFPDTKIRDQGFTLKDLEDLRTIAQNKNKWKINAINLSFVNNAKELDMMIDDLKKLKLQMGIIVKIETQSAFENLPSIILSAMKIYPAAIMLARGDLAIETGWKNFATIQEEIIRVSQAAHIPVIWATQVLETLAKEGIPTRAEITDAALAHRASCVMLNKGKYILKAIKMLDKILKRMEKFKNKKEDLLPKLDGAKKLKMSHKKYDVQ